MDPKAPITEAEIEELREQVEALKRERDARVASVPPRPSARVLRRRAETLLSKRRKRQRTLVRGSRRKNRSR